MTDQTPADEMRHAAKMLRDSHRYDGIKVDSDSRETLELLRDLLAARDPLAALLDEAADRWDVEVEREVVDFPAGGKENFHTDGCELIVRDATDEDRHADWRCSCFDNALAAARAINAKREGV